MWVGADEVDEERGWFRSVEGLSLSGTRETSFEGTGGASSKSTSASASGMAARVEEEVEERGGDLDE